MTAVVVATTAFVACGSTPDDDALVLDLTGFDDMGIIQCDQVSPDLADVDVIQGLCEGGTGGELEVEPFTETSANASFQNNQKLDITINSYTVEILDTGVGPVTRQTTQTVTGKRCSNDATRACAVNADCGLGGILGNCQPSISQVQILLVDFTTKSLIIPDVEPGGKTLDVKVTFSGSDVVGADWQAEGFIAATFTNFNNCDCELSQ